nr:MAG TPA: hypothetical protein [Bacteriophage sp.]
MVHSVLRPMDFTSFTGEYRQNTNGDYKRLPDG